MYVTNECPVCHQVFDRDTPETPVLYGIYIRVTWIINANAASSKNFFLNSSHKITSPNLDNHLLYMFQDD